jgi:hypothetical protein
VIVRDSGSYAVYRNNVQQFYECNAEGHYLWVPSLESYAVWGPEQVPAGNNVNNYTPVSNDLSGTGSSSDPWVVTTVVDVGGTGLQLTQQISYVNGEEYITNDWSLHNNTSFSFPGMHLFHAADLYTDNDDSGYGYYDSSTGAIGGYDQDLTNYQIFIPQPGTPAGHYEESRYYTIWNNIGSVSGPGTGLSDSCLCNEYLDNGAGLEWVFDLSPFGTYQVQDRLSFTDAPPNSTPTSTPTTTPTPTPTLTPTPTPEPQPPPYTTSYYIQENSPEAAKKLGCNAREWGAIGNVVLDFGGPRILSQDPIVYGTKLLRKNVTASLDNVEAMVVEFARGYNSPTACGRPPASTPRNLTIIAAVSGTANNIGSTIGSTLWGDNEALNSSHGAAWAGMVDRLYDRFLTEGWLPDIRIAGGHDSEYYGPIEWNCRNRATGYRYSSEQGQCPTVTPTASTFADEWTLYEVQDRSNVGVRHWVEGFVFAQRGMNNLMLYNFGSCEGWPRSGLPSTWSDSQNQTLERVYRLSWELGNEAAIPQIYKAPYAWEWYNVRWYAALPPRNNYMIIYGVMSGCQPGSDCLARNLSTRLAARFDVACHPNSSPRCQDPNPEPNWNHYGCDTSIVCWFLAPSIAWQALSDMISSPNDPDGNPNPEVTRQFAISTGVTNMIWQ